MSRQFGVPATFRVLSLLATLVILTLITFLPGAASSESEHPQDLSLDPSRVEITFLMPKRFAVGHQATTNILRIYTNGQVLAHDKSSPQVVLVQRVVADGVVVRDTRTGRDRLVRLGQLLPGSPSTTLVGTVLLTSLEYRIKKVDRVAEGEPRLVMLKGSKATLEKQVRRAYGGRQPLPPLRSQGGGKSARKRGPAPKPSKVTVFDKIRVNQLDEDHYLVDSETLRPAIEEVGKTLSLMMPRVRETLFGQTGMTLSISSAAGSGTLGPQGFTVTNLSVAQTLGVQVGDTIISLNGHQVNSPMNAWWTFQTLFIRNQGFSTLQVQIDRKGTRLIKTYSIK